MPTQNIYVGRLFIDKMAGQPVGRVKIITPEGEATRPTSGRLREALFNICQGEMDEASFLDLFAGSGAMGLEALSRGAREAVFVEQSRPAL